MGTDGRHRRHHLHLHRILPAQRLQQHHDFAHGFIDQHVGFPFLIGAVQFVHQPDGLRDALDFLFGPLNVAVLRAVLRNHVPEQAEGVGDACQRVVDFVGDPGGHSPGGRQLLRLQSPLLAPLQFFLRPLALGDVGGEGGNPRDSAFLVQDRAEIDVESSSSRSSSKRTGLPERRTFSNCSLRDLATWAGKNANNSLLRSSCSVSPIRWSVASFAASMIASRSNSTIDSVAAFSTAASVLSLRCSSSSVRLRSARACRTVMPNARSPASSSRSRISSKVEVLGSVE
jgi:hypothetical protein